jgi:hypothetical protein
MRAGATVRLLLHVTCVVMFVVCISVYTRNSGIAQGSFESTSIGSSAPGQFKQLMWLGSFSVGFRWGDEKCRGRAGIDQQQVIYTTTHKNLWFSNVLDVRRIYAPGSPHRVELPHYTIVIVDMVILFWLCVLAFLYEIIVPSQRRFIMKQYRSAANKLHTIIMRRPLRRGFGVIIQTPITKL